MTLDIAYYKKNVEIELKRAAGKNEWLDALRRSLGSAETS